MSEMRGRREQSRVDRRSFIGMAVETVAALAALPAASALLSACGGGEEAARPAPAAPAPSSGAPEPQAAPAAPQPKPPAPAAPTVETGERTLVTEVDAMRPTVQALQYVNASTKADQHCSNCLFYTAADDGRGKCQLFTQGYVSAGGWCSSWSARPST